MMKFTFSLFSFPPHLLLSPMSPSLGIEITSNKLILRFAFDN